MGPVLSDAVRNPHLDTLVRDVLYHFGLETAIKHEDGEIESLLDQLKEMFGDVKFVCTGGSADRAENFVGKAAAELGIEVPDEGLRPIGKTERYSMFKAGPILSVNHGMGQPSLEIMLNEIAKLLHYAGCEDVTFLRIGTSGGVGVEGGTVVVTEEGLDGELEPHFTSVQLGKRRTYPTQTNAELVQELMEVADELGDRVRAVVGKTMTGAGFYEEQGRLDGALRPEYTEEEKMEFLERAHGEGVRNIEMEACKFASFCLRAGIPAVIVCAALLNRLDGDQVEASSEELAQYSDNAQTLVIEWIRRRLARSGAVVRGG
jgi:uridine phosphorylase